MLKMKGLTLPNRNFSIMRLLFIFILLSPLRILAQSWLFPINAETSQVSFERIKESTKSKDQLFKRAQRWGVKSFNDYKGVLQSESPETGMIILKSKYETPNGITRTREFIHFTITVECKDLKYRAIVDDFYNKTHLNTGFVLDLNVNNNLAIGDSTKMKDQDYQEQLIRFREKNELLISVVNQLLNSLDIEMKKKDDF